MAGTQLFSAIIHIGAQLMYERIYINQKLMGPPKERHCSNQTVLVSSSLRKEVREKKKTWNSMLKEQIQY